MTPRNGLNAVEKKKGVKQDKRTIDNEKFHSSFGYGIYLLNEKKESIHQKLKLICLLGKSRKSLRNTYSNLNCSKKKKKEEEKRLDCFINTHANVVLIMIIMHIRISDN